MVTYIYRGQCLYEDLPVNANLGDVYMITGFKSSNENRDLFNTIIRPYDKLFKSEAGWIIFRENDQLRFRCYMITISKDLADRGKPFTATIEELKAISLVFKNMPADFTARNIIEVKHSLTCDTIISTSSDVYFKMFMENIQM